MSNHSILRISRDIADIQNGTDLSLAVAYQDDDVRHVQTLIVGPPGTPYEYGFFEFAVKFGSDYPSTPPKVVAITTNKGLCRFNPNIYADGKVCLSILGTWDGDRGEQWSAAQGLESVLLSIQSLMSHNPYENEPGYEESKGEIDIEVRQAYCDKIRHETLRIAVIQKLESALNIQSDGTTSRSTADSRLTLPPLSFGINEDDEVVVTNELAYVVEKNKVIPFNPFEDLVKRRFLWYYETYLNAIELGAQKYGDQTEFELMPFEVESNEMAGLFQYTDLRRRLVRIKEVIHDETQSWEKIGLLAVEQELDIARNLQSQFDQFADYQKQLRLYNIHVDLLDKNPFVWLVTYVGQSGSNLEGGVFQIRLSLSLKFPEEQPRVLVKPAMYHHRVSKDGVLCYFPTGGEEVRSHIVAIVQAIEETSPPYDPRATVRPEATKLLWGSEGERKQYHRFQRRSAQDSVENGSE